MRTAGLLAATASRQRWGQLLRSADFAGADSRSTVLVAFPIPHWRSALLQLRVVLSHSRSFQAQTTDNTRKSQLRVESTVDIRVLTAALAIDVAVDRFVRYPTFGVRLPFQAPSDLRRRPTVAQPRHDVLSKNRTAEQLRTSGSAACRHLLACHRVVAAVFLTPAIAEVDVVKVTAGFPMDRGTVPAQPARDFRD